MLVTKQDLALSHSLMSYVYINFKIFCFPGETNAQMSRMTEELSGKSDELIRYQKRFYLSCLRL